MYCNFTEKVKCKKMLCENSFIRFSETKLIKPVTVSFCCCCCFWSTHYKVLLFLVLFQALLDLLSKIIHNSDQNKMSLNNVAMIMAPNLFMAPKVRSSKPSWDYELSMAARTSNMTRMLICYKPIFWSVSQLFMLIFVF